MKIFKKMKKGFTLVELVVVIAVIAILAAVSVGAYFGVTESANNSRLEQEAKQVYTAIQTVSLAPNEHSSLSKDGLVITDDSKFELALEETLGKNVTLLENGDKAPNEPTIYFVRKDVSSEISENVVYSSFEYHVAEINGKKAVADIVTGEVKVETSNVEAGEGSSTTTAPGASSTPTTGNPTTAPGNPDISEEPQTKPTFNKITAEQSDWSGTYIIGSFVEEELYIFNSALDELDVVNSYVNPNEYSFEENTISIDSKYAFTINAIEGGYSILSNKHVYIGGESEPSTNGLVEDTENAIINSISYDMEGGNSVDIITSNNFLRFNDTEGQYRFRYYKQETYTDQNAIVLFKLSTEEIHNTSVSLSNISSTEQTINFETIGESKTLNVFAHYSNGRTLIINNESVSWESKNVSVATVTKGVVVSVSEGETVIVATYNEKSLNINVIVSVDETTNETRVIFELGDNGTAEHKDGSSTTSTYTENNGTYTLNITGGDKMYPSSFDAKGNSCLKFGAGSAVGKMSFTVPNDVKKVILYAGKYKTNTTKISVNEVSYTLQKNSNDGAYDAIEVDTSSTKTVSFTTVSGGVRAMLNTIVFVVSSN